MVGRHTGNSDSESNDGGQICFRSLLPALYLYLIGARQPSQTGFGQLGLLWPTANSGKETAINVAHVIPPAAQRVHQV